MSIQSEINRIKTNVSNALTAIRGKGVTVPTSANSDSLKSLIEMIQQGGGSLPATISDVNAGIIETADVVNGGTPITINHNCGYVPDMFIFYPLDANTAFTYTTLFMVRCSEISYRGTAYHTLVSYRNNTTTTGASATYVNSSKGGIYGLTATTATIGAHSSNYHIREGSYRWIAIKFA